MPRNLVPVIIRPHLVQFLFMEFPGYEYANYQGTKVKAVRISTRNYFGKLIRLLVKKSDTPAACDKRSTIFLSISEKQERKKYIGKIYGYVDGRNKFLEIPEEGVKMINDHLEGLFRSATLFYLDGWTDKEGEDGLSIGIKKFIAKYNLLEFGFDDENVRRNYYRWKKEENRLSFISNQASNRVHNY